MDDIISYTYAEASKASGLGKSKLKELIATGELEAASVGRRTLILANSLREMIERHKGRGEYPLIPLFLFNDTFEIGQRQFRNG